MLNIKSTYFLQILKKVKHFISKSGSTCEKDCKIDNLDKAQKEFEKKLELYETNLITFAKHMQGVCEHVDDLAVELDDTLGNITAESEDNLMEKTFNNPSLGFNC